MKKLSLLASAVALTASSLFGDIAVGKGLTVSGYLDFKYENVSTDLPAATADKSGFDTSAAEIDFNFDFGNGLSATVDLDSTVDNGGADAGIEQARIDYSFGDSTITMGKFDTVIGLEGLEAPDLYQITNSLTFDLEPTQHTGIMYGYDNGMFNFGLGLVNSINVDDDNSTGTSEDLSYLVHVGLTPTESLSFNANYATGDESGAANSSAGATSANPDEVTIFTLDASWSDFGWTVGLEYVSAEVDTNAGVTDSETDGYMVMVNYMFTEQFGLTGRYSTTEDDVAGGDEKNEFTISPSYAVTPNWFLLAEYRMDETEDNTGTTAESDTIAIESVLTF